MLSPPQNHTGCFLLGRMLLGRVLLAKKYLRFSSRGTYFQWLNKNLVLNSMIFRWHVCVLLLLFLDFANHAKLKPFGRLGDFNLPDYDDVGVANYDVSVLASKQKVAFFLTINYPIFSPLHVSPSLSHCILVFMPSLTQPAAAQSDNIYFTHARQRSWWLLKLVILTFDPLFI